MEKAVTCSVYLINKRQEVSNDTERERSQSPGIIQYVCCMQNIKNTNIILIQGHRHPHIIKSPHLFSSSVLLIKGNRLCSTTLGMRRSSGRQSRVDFTAGASLLWQRGSLVGAAQVCGLWNVSRVQLELLGAHLTSLPIPWALLGPFSIGLSLWGTPLSYSAPRTILVDFGRRGGKCEM